MNRNRLKASRGHCRDQLSKKKKKNREKKSQMIETKKQTISSLLYTQFVIAYIFTIIAMHICYYYSPEASVISRFRIKGIEFNENEQ